MSTPVHPPTDVSRQFIDVAHSIAWATAATVDPSNRPRTRILHPLWSLENGTLSGVIATGPTPAKSADLSHSPYMSLSYWAPTHDTCRVDCTVTWATDDETCTRVWEAFKAAPEPVGYDPAIIPAWQEGPTSAAFCVLRLQPYRIRVLAGESLAAGRPPLTWSANERS